jgi:hypothetical protein
LLGRAVALSKDSETVSAVLSDKPAVQQPLA